MLSFPLYLFIGNGIDKTVNYANDNNNEDDDNNDDDKRGRNRK